MKRFLILLLICSILLVGCQIPDDSTQVPNSKDSEQATTLPDADSGSEEESDPSGPALPPEAAGVAIPPPFLDIEFTEEGNAYDRMDRVVCTIDQPILGYVETSAVIHNGQSYVVPHYSVKQAGGTLRMNYRDLTDSNTLYQQLCDGFTMEAFLVNHVALTPTSAEHAMIASCQSGGYNLTTYLGKYTFSVHTGGSYSNAFLHEPYDTTELSHLVAVYDAERGLATLYVNGVAVETVDASGTLRLGNNLAYRTIIMGGDITGDGVSTSTYASSLDVVDFKMYNSTLTEEQCHALYTVATGRLAGDDSWQSEILLDTVPVKVGYDSEEDSFVQTIYEAETGLHIAPTVWEYGNTELAELPLKDCKPATVMLDVALHGNHLYAFDTNGGAVGYLRQVVLALRGASMPAFRVNDSTVAEHLNSFLKEYDLADCFIVSSDADLLKSLAKQSCPARLVLDRSDVLTFDVTELFAEAAAAGSKTVLLPAELLNAENVIDLRTHSFSVVAVLGKNATRTDIHNAIFSGVTGLLGYESEAIFDYYETIIDRTVALSPILVAHRGDSVAYPDNSMRGILSAIASGADVVEIDVRLTSDGHVVVNHDAKATGFSEELTIASSTRAQLEALTYVKADGVPEDRMLFLDVLLARLRAEECSAVIVIELKVASVEMIDAVVAVVKEFKMSGQVLLIGMNELVSTYTWNEYGMATQLNLSNFVTADDPFGSLVAATQESVRLHSSCFSKVADEKPEFIRAIHHRLIKYSTWTLNTQKQTLEHFFTGVPEFTTDVPHTFDSVLRYLKVSVGEGGRVTVIGVCYDGTELDVTDRVEAVPISGSVQFENGILTGSGSVAFRLETSLPTETPETFYLYSSAVVRS